MVIVCWSVKGGSGTTVVATCLATLAARVTDRSTLLVDLAGDVPAALGVDDVPGAGVSEWMDAVTPVPGAVRASASAPRLTLSTAPVRGVPGAPGPWRPSGGRSTAVDPGELERPVDERLSILPRGMTPVPGVAESAGDLLAGRLAADGRLVVVDAGTWTPGAPPDVADRLVAAADRSLLVIRSCYLALRHAAKHPRPTDGVVLIEEPGRSLTAEDVASVTGVPVVATVACEPQVARVVDAGLLRSRVPRGVERALCGLVEG